MVYLLDSQYCHSGYELTRKRNTLFTAVTRSRAWVRICGYGPGMIELEGELREVIGKGYLLDFNVPTLPELEKIRRIHRDMTPDEKRRLTEAKKSAEILLKQLESGDLDVEHLPANLRDRLKELFGNAGDDT